MKYLKIILCLFLFLGVIGLFSVLLRDNSNDSIFSKETFSHDQSDCESESFIFEETTDSVDSNIESNTDFLEETTDILESNIEVDTDLSEETFDDQVFSSSKYLVFGDSIAAGSGLESRKHSYPNRAGALLNVEHVSNNAVGGSTLALDPNNEKRRCIANDVVEFASKSSVSYDIISIAGGVNDKSNNLPIGDIDDFTNETVYGSLNIIVQTVQAKWPDAFFFLVTPLKCRSYNKVNNAGYVLSDVADAIKAIGEKYDVPVLDLYNTSGFETASNGMNHPDCDGCHPLQGFIDEYLAPQVADFVRKNYKGK